MKIKPPDQGEAVVKLPRPEPKTPDSKAVDRLLRLALGTPCVPCQGKRGKACDACQGTGLVPLPKAVDLDEELKALKAQAAKTSTAPYLWAGTTTTERVQYRRWPTLEELPVPHAPCLKCGRNVVTTSATVWETREHGIEGVVCNQCFFPHRFRIKIKVPRQTTKVKLPRVKTSKIRIRPPKE